ncbi:MAG: Gfo/Idh/MocA family oxidoreductase, partial [Flavobacteriaceae bacterium]
MSKLNRRNFIRKTSLAGAAVSLGPMVAKATESYSDRPFMHKYMGDFAAPKLETVKAAFIGVGARGPGHLQFFADLPGTEVVAICDLYEDLAKKWGDEAKKIGAGKRHQDIKLYFGDENKWKTMLKEVKPDVVFVVTNWENHAPMVIEAMKNGAHAFCEVPLALTTKEMWDIVDTSEATGKHCMMMENVNYAREELMYLNMCRLGVIGEPLHAEAAYIHELRFQMEEQERGTGSWRTYQYANRNGNLYPTHGLGPVAQYMNLART